MRVRDVELDAGVALDEEDEDDDAAAAPVVVELSNPCSRFGVELLLLLEVGSKVPHGPDVTTALVREPDDGDGRTAALRRSADAADAALDAGDALDDDDVDDEDDEDDGGDAGADDMDDDDDGDGLVAPPMPRPEPAPHSLAFLRGRYL